MEQTPSKETVDRWHRWFAVECNNAAWDLAAKSNRPTEENREMLSAAYAAAFHWAKIGQPINAARADLLLAHVHALLGDARAARRLAERCLAFCQTEKCEDWDLAFAHAEMAHAAAVEGNAQLHATHFAAAKEKGTAIKDDEERRMFFETFARIPAR
jgi:hypothetical protein